jgi:hypothetical protein
MAGQRANLLIELRTLRASLAETKQRENQLKGPAATAAPKQAMSEEEAAAWQQQRRVRILHAWLALRNAALYAKLGLSPEQISKYEDIVTNHFLRMQDIAESAQSQKILRTDPVIVQMENEENQQYMQEMTQNLDPAEGQAIAAFEKLSPARALVNAVAGNMYYTDDPLTPQQADQLTQILANNSAHYVGGRHVDMKDLDMATALTQAQAVLSPAQLAALNNINQGSQSLTQYQKVMQSLTPPPGAQNQSAAVGK